MKRVGIWAITLLTAALAVALFWELTPNIAGNYVLRFNAYIIGLIVSVIIMAVLLVLVFRTRAKSTVIVWFSLLITVVLCWSGTYILIAWSANGETAQFWQHILTIFWMTSPLMLTMFVISYVDDQGLLSTPLLWFVIPPLAILLVYIVGYGDLAQTREPFKQFYFYWGYESDYGKMANLIFIWQIVTTVIDFAILAAAYRKITNRLKRKQTMIFIVAIGQYLALAIIFDIVLYALDLNGFIRLKWPPFIFLYSSFLAIIMAYGIIRYGVFRVNPASLSGPILANLSEAVVAVNNDLEVEFTNKGTEQITGYPQDLLKGQHVSMLFDTTVFQGIIKGMNASKEDYVTEDTLIKNSKGNSIPVALSVGGVYDDRQQQAGFIFVFANITELKKKTIELAREKAGVEQKVRERTAELSEERARLSASINSLKLGYIMTGQHGEIQVMNQAAHRLLERLAVAQDKEIPQNWRLTDVQDIFKAGTDIMDPIRRIQKSPHPLEIKEVQIGGRFLYVFVAPVTENNQVIGSVVLFEDITDEKALNRSKEEFFIIASHELRTPLTKIRGSAELMNDVYKKSITSDDALHMLQEIEVSSTHLIEIVNMMIEISELEQGKVSLKPEPVDVIALTKDVLQSMAKKIDKPKVKPQIACSLKQLIVNTDEASLRQILEGFVSNAYKFTDEGNVTVHIKPEDEHIRFRISDTGKGIELENHGLLFRKFQQAGSSLLSRDAEGTGLGLYVVKLLTGIMGGKVGLESSEVGKGSTFFFTIPVNPPAQPEGAIAKKASI